ncbi:MAG: hypothetical protein OXI20_15940, partial [Rhodospirillales bacterium]|nr:hypothetical protein [Rhodospirillales bacterium]
MRLFRFLFAPELGRPIADALRSAAVLRSLIEAARRPGSSAAGRDGQDCEGARRGTPADGGGGGRPRTLVPGTGGSSSRLLWIALLLGAAGLGLTAIPPPDPASGQSIDRGLFADTDSATQDVLSFLGGLGRDRPSAVGDMLFAFNAGVLVLAGFLLVWHAAAGVVDTAR